MLYAVLPRLVARCSLRVSAVAAARPVFALRSFATAAPAGQVQSFLDKTEVTERVIAVLKNFEKVDAAKLTPTAHFSNDLGLDSLDAVEVSMALEEEFCITIPDAEAEKILSVQDAVAFVSTHPQAK